MYEMFHDIDLYRNHFLGNKNSTSSERVKFLTFNSQLSISLWHENYLILEYLILVCVLRLTRLIKMNAMKLSNLIQTYSSDSVDLLRVKNTINNFNSWKLFWL